MHSTPLRHHAASVAMLATCLLVCACDGEISSSNKGAPDSGSSQYGSDQGGLTPGLDAGSPSPDAGGRDLGGDLGRLPDQGVNPDMAQPDPPERPNAIAQDELFMCEGVPGSSPARLRRIDREEWAVSIHSDRGLQVPLLASAQDAFSTYTSDETMDTAILREFLRHSGVPAGSWGVPNNNGNPRIKILRGEGSVANQIKCFQDTYQGVPAQADPTQECTRSFVTTILEHGVYFRPPTPGEVDRLVAFADAQIDKELADPEIDRRKTIETIVRAAWMTRGALFHDEIGQGQELPDGRRALSDRELAQALSLAIGDHIAGVSRSGYVNEEGEDNRHLQDMHDAATAGVLSDPATIEALVRKHLAGLDPASVDPAAHPSSYPVGSRDYEDQYWMSHKLRGFFREWLDYAHVTSIFKDTPEATSRFGDGTLLEAYYPGENSSTFRGRNRRRHDGAYNGGELVKHLDNTIARIVAEDQDVLRELLTTRRFLIPATGDDPYVGTLYNLHTAESGPLDSLEQRWVTLPGPERAGVLTHPAWLAAHGGNFENDPAIIYRGKWVREHLLCDDLPDIPLDVDAMLDPDTQDQSARLRVSQATEQDTYCASCHARMNPLGYPFEIYNHAGFLRSEDHGAPPDGSATLLLLPADPVLRDQMVVNDAVDMMQTFAESPRVKRCFIRQSFRYFTGRNEVLRDACTLSQMEQAYDDSGGSLIAMLVALFQSDAFLYRHDEP